MTNLTQTLFNEEIKLERANNDANGNPRYILHFTAVSRKLKGELGDAIKDRDMYLLSVQAAGRGFNKYRAKSYGGGIIFQSYNIAKDLEYLENNVNAFIAKFKGNK